MGDLSQGHVFFLLVSYVGVPGRGDSTAPVCPWVVYPALGFSLVSVYCDSSYGSSGPASHVSGGMGPCHAEHVGNGGVCGGFCRGADVFDARTIAQVQAI